MKRSFAVPASSSRLPWKDDHQHQYHRSTGAPASSSRQPWKGLPPRQLWRAATASHGRNDHQHQHHRSTGAPASSSRQPWKGLPPRQLWRAATACHGRNDYRSSTSATAQRARLLHHRVCHGRTTTAPALESCQHQHHGSTGVPTSSLVYSQNVNIITL